MSRIFTMPQTLLTGEKAIEDALPHFQQAGKKALIVTGKHVVKLDFFQRILKTLEEGKISYVVFSDITGEPTDDMITQGLDVYQKEACDFFIGAGGGSPLDSIKAIAVLSVLGGNIADYMGQNIQAKVPPLIAIPTTAGTGSEATKFTVITDLKKDIKMLLKGDCLLPTVAILDEEATLSCPKSITASTGIDALTHAVEAYTSKLAQPLTDVLAKSAVVKIMKYLPRAYQDGSDKEARIQMAMASFEAGVVINNSSVTLVHGMSRPIGALFHVPHGISNAMLLPSCMKFALSGNLKKFADLGRAVGIAEEDDQKTAEAFIVELEKICGICEIPTLKQYGIDMEEFASKMDKMATDAIASGSPSNTVLPVTKEDVLALYKQVSC